MKIYGVDSGGPGRLGLYAVGLAVFGALSMGCELIASVDHDDIPKEGSGGSTGGTGGATGASGGVGNSGGSTGGSGAQGGGGSGGCSMASECPDPMPECRVATCEGMECGEGLAAEGDACDDGMGGVVCTAAGDCVECNVAGDCAGANPACQNNMCVPDHCTNGATDTALGETDEDCGGPCAGCALTLACMVFDDCLSGVCTGNVCVACAADGECTANAAETWCNAATDGGTCEPTKTAGLDCVGSNECNGTTAPGGCVDGFCCAATCDTECDGCAQTLTGMSNGTCAEFTNGTADPDFCLAASCPTQTTAQAAQTCQAGACSPGQVTCMGGNICAAGACLTGCLNDTQCTDATWCDEVTSMDCEPDGIIGDPCGNDNECTSNINCVDSFCCNAPCAGGCQSCSVNPGTCTTLMDGDTGTGCGLYLCSGGTTCPGAGTCVAHTDCTTNAWCDHAGIGNTGDCLADLGTGVACTDNEQCINGTCAGTCN